MPSDTEKPKKRLSPFDPRPALAGSISGPDWLSARARNATRRHGRIAIIASTTFVVALAALVFSPNARHRQAPRIVPTLKIDTASTSRDLVVASVRRLAADSALAVARAQADTVHAQAAARDAQKPGLLAKRDSISMVIAQLSAPITKVESAPLPSSYRELASARPLQGNAHVAALVDSLGALERARDTIDRSGAGSDSTFMALTGRITDVGKAIEGVAVAKREVLRHDLDDVTAATMHVAVDTSSASAPDSTAWLAERDSAISAAKVAGVTMAAQRDSLLANATDIARAQHDAEMVLSPVAMLCAAIVIGLVVGFWFSLAAELRAPRVADAREVERLLGTRVIAVVRPGVAPVERTRRTADRLVPQHIEPTSDVYRRIAHAVNAGAGTRQLTVAGDDSVVAAVIAANLSAIATDESHATLLVDADRNASASAVLGARSTPGAADVASGRATLTDATVRAVVGRDRVVDLLPPGATGLSADDTDRLIESERARLMSRYDVVVIATSLAEIAGGPTLLCARAAHTELHELAQAKARIIEHGGSLLGVVLWDGPLPMISSASARHETRAAARPTSAPHTPAGVPA